MEESGEQLAERLGEALRAADATIAVAESCTGGLIGATLTDVPGASDYFDRAIVTYSNRAKQAELGVSRETLDDVGAVSAPVARAMARGVCDVADTDWGVSATGIAGPGGGTEDKPVGTVYVGVAHAAEWGTGNSYTAATRYVLDGDRREVRERTARRALADVLAALSPSTQ